MGEDIDWASVFAAIDNSAGVGEGGAVAQGRGEGKQQGGGSAAASSHQHQHQHQQQHQHHHQAQHQHQHQAQHQHQQQHQRQAAPATTAKAGPNWAVPQSPVSTPGGGNNSTSNGWHDLLAQSQSHFRTRTPPNPMLTGDANVSPSTGNPNSGGPSSAGPSSRPGSHRTHSLPHPSQPHVSPHDRNLSFDLTAWPWASSSAAVSASASANASTSASTHPSPQTQAQALGLSASFSVPGSATLPSLHTSSTEAARELNARALKRQNSSGLALNTTTVFPNPPLSAPLPGQGQGRSNSQSSSTASTPLTQLESLPLALENTPDTLADNEDKRMRNTLASAKFRAKKKQHIAGVQRTISDLETQHTELQKDVVSLRQENGLLREMVQIKYGLDMKKPQ